MVLTLKSGVVYRSTPSTFTHTVCVSLACSVLLGLVVTLSPSFHCDKAGCPFVITFQLDEIVLQMGSS